MKFGNYNENLTNNISFPVKFEKRDVKFVCHVFRFSIYPANNVSGNCNMPDIISFHSGK